MKHRLIAAARWMEEAFLQINPAFHLMRATLKKADEDAAAIQRVRELHFEYYGNIADTYCGHCGTQYPCDTIRALDGDV